MSFTISPSPFSESGWFWDWDKRAQNRGVIPIYESSFVSVQGKVNTHQPIRPGYGLQNSVFYQVLPSWWVPA